MRSLRTELQKITRDRNITNHERGITVLRERVPHSIKMLTNPGDDLRYNCVMHALGIAKDKEFVSLVLRCPRTVHAGTRFLKFLKDRSTLVPVEHPTPGLLVA